MTTLERAAGRAGASAARPAAAVAAAFLALLAAAAPARGVAFLELAGAPSSRHPFTARVWPTGPVDAYFNPCLLLDAPSTVLVGPFAFVRELRVSYDARPPGALDPDALPRARGAADDSGASFHVAQGNHTQLIPGRLALGFYLLLAGDAFSPQAPFYPDERERFFSNSLHFELAGDRTEAVAFAFGVGGRPLPWLSLGAGIALALSTDVNATSYVSAPDGGALLERTASDLSIRLAPHFSVAATPLDGLRVTATVHLPVENEAHTTTTVRTRVGDTVEESVREADATYGYLPWRVALGVAWTIGEGGDGEGGDGEGGDGEGGDGGAPADDPEPVWSVAATALWARWSDYRDRGGARPSPGWDDTVTVALGGDVAFGRHAIGLDLRWVPSPVPDQPGRTSYVDNDRLGAAIGYDVRFDVGAVRLVTGAHLHFQGLLPRRVRKAAVAPGPRTAAPGYPGYASDGWLLGAGATLRVQF